MVVDGLLFNVVEQLYFPFKNIKAIRYLPDQFPESDLKDEAFLNAIITEKINQYKVKTIYVFGDNQITRNLNCLRDKNLWVVDIRESNMNELKRLNYDEPYTFNRQPTVDSVSNLCQLLAKNIVSGYFENFIYFNLKSKSYFTHKCNYHRDFQNFIDFNKCVTELNAINRITLMLLRAAVSINKRLQSFTRVEFVWQCIFLHLAFPQNITWKCRDSNVEIHINQVKVLSTFDSHDETDGYRAYVADEIKCFPERIKKVHRVNHRKTGLRENLQNLLSCGIEQKKW